MTQSTSRQQARQLGSGAETTGNTSGYHYADCESVGVCLHRFESCSCHHTDAASSKRLCRVNVHPAAIRDHQTVLAQLGQMVADRRLAQAQHRGQQPADLLTSRRTEQIRHDPDPHRISQGPTRPQLSPPSRLATNLPEAAQALRRPCQKRMLSCYSESLRRDGGVGISSNDASRHELSLRDRIGRRVGLDVLTPSTHEKEPAGNDWEQGVTSRNEVAFQKAYCLVGRRFRFPAAPQEKAQVRDAISSLAFPRQRSRPRIANRM